MQRASSESGIIHDSGGLREVLQAETGSLHENLDRQFEAFDLGSLDGYRCFLEAHFIAAEQYQRPVAQFCQASLDCRFPDYLSLLGQDMRELGATATSHKIDNNIAAGDTFRQAGIAYVILGSRLGTASLVRQHAPSLRAKRADLSLAFMSEREGLACWRAFLTWSKTAQLDQDACQQAIAGATAAFAMFSEAARQVVLARSAD